MILRLAFDLFNTITNYEYNINKYIRSPYKLISQYAFKNTMGIKLKEHTLKRIVNNDNTPILKDICIEIREIQEQIEASYYKN